MKTAALVLVLALASSVHADDRLVAADELARHAWKLKLGGEVTVGIAGALLVATAARVAVSDDGAASCGNPCLDHDTVRDMGILAGAATVAFAVGIPLLLQARHERQHALELRGPTIAARF